MRMISTTAMNNVHSLNNHETNKLLFQCPIICELTLLVLVAFVSVVTVLVYPQGRHHGASFVLLLLFSRALIHIGRDSENDSFRHVRDIASGSGC